MIIRQIGANACGELYAHMERDFPANERPPFFALLANIKKGIYDAFFLTEKADEALSEPVNIGYAIVVAPSENSYALLVFFAILPEHRSAGYGGKALEAIRNRYKNKVICIEVENPDFFDGADKETAKKRITFYERSGYRLLKTREVKIFGVDMLIMADFKAEIDNFDIEKDVADLGVKKIMHSFYRPVFSSEKWLKKIEVLE